MRATRKKRPPVMTPKRWVALLIVLFLGILVALNVWYRNVFSDEWAAESIAEKKAAAVANLVEVDGADKYVWDETAWVVQGKTADGKLTYVWLRDQSTESVRAVDAVSEEQIRANILQSKPDASITHIRPGIMNGQHVWEVYYSRVESGERKYAFAFYNFENGTFIDNYKLPASRLAQ
ncbi:conserved hypothetical protein [Paenibacillus curdlanolyticus YK9]|uniref:Cell wall elongation regulator TseB-like domain-containing protein n=1 Tax=Paenibacillus curdlanolyticus YK9 TaxID=717606 RepID=E0IC41_9BACL|nr:DUF5590 domain-containing protein [Paenibacillus curdlanolyticus]EFM09727.1 conserved hypothetical protein [Paenibacillus curdlanolyticus YK9]